MLQLLDVMLNSAAISLRAMRVSIDCRLVHPKHWSDTADRDRERWLHM